MPKNSNPHGGKIGSGAPGRKRHWSGPGRNRTKVKAADTEYAIKRLLDEAARYLEPDIPPVRSPPITIARQLCASLEAAWEHIEGLGRERAEWAANQAAYAALVEGWNRVCDALTAAGASFSLPMHAERWQWSYRGEHGEAQTAGEAMAAVIQKMSQTPP